VLRHDAKAYYRCPIQASLDYLVPDRKEFLRICNFEDKSLAESDRLIMIAESVPDHAIPWLDAHSTIASLQQLMHSDY
jgi:hypothetical protein